MDNLQPPRRERDFAGIGVGLALAAVCSSVVHFWATKSFATEELAPTTPTCKATGGGVKVKTPTNPDELLNNLSTLVKSDFLFQDSTYLNENLTEIFGGLKIDRREVSPKERVVSVTKLGSLFQNSDRLFGIGAEVHIFTRIHSQSGISCKETSKIHVVMDTGYDTRFTAEKVIGVFGTKYSLAQRPDLTARNVLGPQGAVPFTPATNKFGNKRLSYSFNREAISDNISFDLSSDGAVLTISINQEMIGR
jgi:hypothetical protein